MPLRRQENLASLNPFERRVWDFRIRSCIYSSKTISLSYSTRAALFVLKSKSFHKIGTRHDTALEVPRA